MEVQKISKSKSREKKKNVIKNLIYHNNLSSFSLSASNLYSSVCVLVWVADHKRISNAIHLTVP